MTQLVARHWAADLVGQPYTAEKNCWGLVREVFAQQRGIEMPAVQIGGTENLRALKQAVRVAGLRRVDGPPQDGDLVVLRSVLRTHVGIVLRANGGLQVLHSTQAAGVICERWADAARGMTAELWRKVPGLPGQEPDWQDIPEDRDTFRSVLTIAAIIAINVFVPGSGVGFTFGGTTFVVSASTLTFAAVVGINALLPPNGLSAANQAAGPNASGQSFSTSLQGNESRLNGPIWKICGRREITPPYACKPYLEYRPRIGASDPQLDQEQYFYALYAVGVGDHTIHAAKLVDTPISRFEDVLVAQYLAPGVQPSLVNANVSTTPEVSGLVLESLRFTSGFPACRAGRTCTKIAVDLAAPRGLGKGADALTVRWRTQYRQVDDFGRVLSGWANLGSADQFRTAYTSTPQRWTVEHTLPSPGRVEIRIVRVDVQDTDPSALHELVWVGLRGYMAEEAPLNPNTAHYEVVLRASSQLSEVSSGQLVLVAEGHAESLDSGLDRVTAAATRNGAWWLLDLATSPIWGVGKPDDRVDLQSFYDLAQTAAARQDRFDYVFDSTVNAWDGMQMIARSMRARVFRRNGLISVARDELVDVPVTLFSHRNCKPGISISEKLRTRQSPDGIIAEYQDHRTSEWTEIECPCPGVTTMTNPVRKRYEGIVGAKHAEREGLYDAANLLYRTRSLQVATELQGILPAYMSAVEVLPDIQGYGSSGDVCFWDQGTLTMGLSEPADFSAGPLYLRLLRDDGSPTDEVLVSPGPTTNDVVLPAAPDFELVLDDGTRERPKYLLGRKELCKVVAIQDGGKEEGAQLYTLPMLIDDARVHQADVHLLPGPGEVQDPVGSSADPPGGGGGEGEGEYIPPPLVVALRDTDITTENTPEVECGFILKNNGRAFASIGGSETPYEGMWLLAAPVEVAQAGQFEVYFELFSGALVSGTVNTWMALDTDRSVVAVAQPGYVPNILGVSIRDSLTGIVQAQCTLSLQSPVQPG